jgi:hypothetical protein
MPEGPLFEFTFLIERWYHEVVAQPRADRRHAHLRAVVVERPRGDARRALGLWLAARRAALRGTVTARSERRSVPS